MAERWFVVAKPDADLTPIDPAPVQREDGATWQRFSTQFGKVFAEIVHPHKQVIWMQKVGG